MNAVIALGHFCDSHGPRTIFCTQAFKYTDLQNTYKQNLDLVNEEHVILGAAPPKTFSPDLSSLQQSQAQRSQASNVSSTTESTCKACRAFEKNFHHYISYDSDQLNVEGENSLSSLSCNICYISQSTPSDSEVFALVRKACLRTLHCEVFEDPIYFDDDKNGSVIGYEFHIKDSEGRGQQRAYSLLIIMKDRIYLQHLWSFLSQQMAIIATNIKREAQRKFEKDLRENPQMSASGGLHATRSFAHALKKKDRGLIELTDDPMIFAKLHMWFTWIMRMSSCQISEEFIHGPLSEDIQVKLEQQELLNGDAMAMPCNNNGFMNKSFSNCSISEVSVENLSFRNLDAEFENCLRLEKNNNWPNSNEYENEAILNSLQVENLRQFIEVRKFFIKYRFESLIPSNCKDFNLGLFNYISLLIKPTLE